MHQSRPTISLALTVHQVDRLRAHLLRDDGFERLAYLYCSPSGSTRLLADELVSITDEELATQSQTACRPDLSVERKLLTDCCRRNLHPLIVHSHPFDEVPTYSKQDQDLMADLQQMIAGLWPDKSIHVMFAILGTHGITTSIYDQQTDRFVDLPIDVLGHRRVNPPLQTPARMVPVDPHAPRNASINDQRLDRNIRAITEYGQQQLAATHIAVVGCGGLGSLMAEEYARYGVQHLTLIDPDVVEESNLPRLFGAYDHHIDRPKVEVMKEHLQKVNPAIDVTTVQDMAENAEDALKSVYLIVAGLDRVSTRMWLNQFSVKHLLPYIDAGVRITTADEQNPENDPSAYVDEMDGFIQRIVPGVTACFDCLKRADSEEARIERLSDAELNAEIERGYVDETALSPEPAVVPLNGIVASKAVQLVAKHITGYARPADFLHIECVANEITELTTTPRETCPTCPPDGIRGSGDRTPPLDSNSARHDDLDLDIDVLPAADTKQPIDSAVGHGLDWLFATTQLDT